MKVSDPCETIKKEKANEYPPYVLRVSRPQHKEHKWCPPDSLSWAQSWKSWRLRQSELTVWDRREQQKKNAGDMQKFCHECSSEYRSANACEKTTWCQGKSFPKRLEKAGFDGHTGPGRVSELTSQTGKPHIYEMCGRILKNLTLAVGKKLAIG